MSQWTKLTLSKSEAATVMFKVVDTQMRMISSGNLAVLDVYVENNMDNLDTETLYFSPKAYAMGVSFGAVVCDAPDVSMLGKVSAD